MFYGMNSILQIGALSLGVTLVAFVAMSSMYAVHAVKPTQNWCIHTDFGNKDICGYTSHKQCDTARDEILPIYTDATRCFKNQA